MSDDIFLSALGRITGGDFQLTDLIDVAGRLRELGQVSPAEQLYRVWIRFNPEHPHLYAAWFNLSTLPGLAPAAAMESLNQTLALKPDFWPGHINLGGVFERAGDLDRAVAQWQQVTDGL